MIRVLHPSAHYRAVYLTLYRMERRHWRYAVVTPANDGGC